MIYWRSFSEVFASTWNVETLFACNNFSNLGQIHSINFRLSCDISSHDHNTSDSGMCTKGSCSVAGSWNGFPQKYQNIKTHESNSMSIQVIEGCRIPWWYGVVKKYLPTIKNQINVANDKKIYRNVFIYTI